jgi:serine/threonine/tyrosine protein kinase RAD53
MSQTPYPHNDAMSMDGIVENSQDIDMQTQQTQQTEQLSQLNSTTMDGHLWGFLQPCSAALARIDFWKLSPTYTIGRNQDCNNVVLHGLKVSEYYIHYVSFSYLTCL